MGINQQIIRENKDPKKVMDTLTGEFYKTVLDIRATVCLVEAHKLNEINAHKTATNKFTSVN